MKGQQIHNLRQLRQAAEERRSVIVPKLHRAKKPKPAAFIINQSGTVLLMLFRFGMFIYEKDGKT